MNAVTSAALIGAAGAGAPPGAIAGGPLAPGQSFDDVFRQLSGGDLGSAGTGDQTGVARALVSADAGGSTSESGASGAAEAPALAAEDVTAAMGAISVPVAPLLQATPAPAPADAAGAATLVESDAAGRDGRAADVDVTSQHAGAARGGLARTGLSRASGVAGIALERRADATPGRAEPSSSFAADLRDEIASGGGTEAETAETLNTSAGQVERATERMSARGAGGTAAPDRAAVMGRRVPGAVTAATAALPLAETSVPPRETSAPPLEADAASNVMATTTQTAATVMARLLGEPSGDLGRAPGLARALARPVEPLPSPRPAGVVVDAALATVTETTHDGPVPEPRSFVSEPLALMAPVASVLRGQGAVSAAIRAFQQASAPAQDQTSVPTMGGSTDAEPSPGVAAGRLAGFAGAVADTVASAVEPDRRAFVPPVGFTPFPGGDLRVGSDLGVGPRVELTGMPALAHAADEPVHAQIVQSLRVQWAGGAGEARVRLRPEYLGNVVATIKVEQGTVTATLQADTPEVRRWMEANTQSLREGLVEHGLKLDRLVVLSEPTRGESSDSRHGRPRGRQPHQPQPQPRQRRPADANTTFDLDI